MYFQSFLSIFQPCDVGSVDYFNRDMPINVLVDSRVYDIVCLVRVLIDDAIEKNKVKMEEMENNKRNNLIVYGIPNDIRETHSSLHQKVCLHLRFSRYFFLAKAGDAHYQLFIGTILDIGYFQDQTPDSLQLATCKGKLRTR